MHAHTVEYIYICHRDSTLERFRETRETNKIERAKKLNLKRAKRASGEPSARSED